MKNNNFCCLICDCEFSFPAHTKKWPNACPQCGTNPHNIISLENEEDEDEKPRQKLQYT